MASHKTHAPWTFEEVRALNQWQKRGDIHPFMCGGLSNGASCATDLLATTNGWVCPNGCGYTQDWAYGFCLKSAVQKKAGDA